MSNHSKQAFNLCVGSLLRRNRAAAFSFDQSLTDQPLLDELRSLRIVFVHHQHVGIALDTDVGQIDHIDAAAGGLERPDIIEIGLAYLRPTRMVLGVVAEHHEDRRALEQRDLARVTAERGLDSNQRLDLVRSRFRDLEAEGARLAVHHHDAWTDLVHQRDVGSNNCIIGGGPARHALLHELLVGLDRKLRARIGRSLGLVRTPRAGRPDAEALPGVSLREEDRLTLEGVGPAGTPALDCVRDVHIPALADEHGEPALAAVRLGLVGHAGQAAAMPHQQWQLSLTVLRQEVLHIHLLDLIGAVRIDPRRDAAGCEQDLLDRLSRDLDDAPADVERAHIAQHDHVAQRDRLLGLRERRAGEKNGERRDEQRTRQATHGGLSLCLYCRATSGRGR